MSVEHRAWDWNKNASDIWHVPCEESFFLLNRWKAAGFNRFLDLGCGLGRHSLQFALAGFSVDSFDLSPVAVAETRKKAQDSGVSLRAAAGDMNSLPYDAESFDCLLAYHVVSHTDTAGITKTLAEIRRVLRPSGEFFLSLCSKKAWSFAEAGFPKIDENTVMKTEEGPEYGIPHFFADDRTIDSLFRREELVFVKHTQDLIVNGADYGSWHYFILGKNAS